jgi:hypothetical protein
MTTRGVPEVVVAMNAGRILVFHFVQWIPILRGTLISDRPQTLFIMDPNIKGHTISDSLETLQGLEYRKQYNWRSPFTH